MTGNPRCQSPDFLRQIPLQDVAFPDFRCEEGNTGAPGQQGRGRGAVVWESSTLGLPWRGAVLCQGRPQACGGVRSRGTHSQPCTYPAWWRLCDCKSNNVLLVKKKKRKEKKSVCVGNMAKTSLRENQFIFQCIFFIKVHLTQRPTCWLFLTVPDLWVHAACNMQWAFPGPSSAWENAVTLRPRSWPLTLRVSPVATLSFPFTCRMQPSTEHTQTAVGSRFSSDRARWHLSPAVPVPEPCQGNFSPLP